MDIAAADREDGLLTWCRSAAIVLSLVSLLTGVYSHGYDALSRSRTRWIRRISW